MSAAEYRSGGVLECRTCRTCRAMVSRRRLRRRSGFTLVELLLATLIMAIILTAIYSTWSSSLLALKRGRDLTEGQQHRRALLDIVARSFRAAIFSQENATWYSWETLDNGDADFVSFVSTDVPVVGAPAQSGSSAQRIELSLEPDESGQFVLLARVKNFLAYDLDVAQTIRIADWVKTLNLRYYDRDNDEWLDTWEKTDAMPASVEIGITMGSADPGKPDVTVTKAIDIPCTAVAQIGTAPQAGGSRTGTSGQSGRGSGQPSGQGAGQVQSTGGGATSGGGRSSGAR
ncbi:MAG: prepilin-type N-terminal cleavage/methylation domain-containing protein [Verrucomicrobia bacterium]|nr:prepilin-type N-terminal cleavage/methylation domain-containing protein [Verrucomicrobiota bacterium]